MNKYVQGPYAVLMTPFKDGKVDKDGLIKEIEHVNGTGIKGFVSNGSTAEFIQLSLKEQAEVSETVAKNKDANKNLIVSACTGNAVDTLSLCKNAKEIGAQAVLVCSPYYFKYTESEKERYFTEVADNSPVPIVLYNIPFFTQEIELSLAFRLLNHENVIGIKDSSANMKRIMHMISVTENSRVSILTGTDDILSSALFAGCAGSFTAFATIFPDKVSLLYESFYKGDYKKTAEIQASFMPLLRQADSETFPFGYKELMEKTSGIKFGNKEIGK